MQSRLKPWTGSSVLNSKILTHEEAKCLIKVPGFIWVMCHGCFDLLHIGHIKHLQAAREMGDYLVVSITADAFVNKGPGRPVFSADKRAEMLAALECVDYVVIVDGASAIPAIEAIMPDIYCKGSDYKSEDITGKFDLERDAVEKNGGRIVFTDEEVHSSSSLINEFLPQFDQETTSLLQRMKEDRSAELIDGYLDQIKSLKVLLVGEQIHDHYVYVSSLGKAAKENIIATQFKSEEWFEGGTDATGMHIDGLVEAVHASCRRRVTKTRFIEPPYTRKLFEIYEMSDTPMDGEEIADLIAELRGGIEWADLVIVCDYGHGMIGPEVVEVLQDCSKFLAVNVQTNAGNLGYNLLTKYKRADFLVVDAMEARLAAQDKHRPLDELAGRVLPSLIACKNIVVTHGSAGCYVYQWSKTRGKARAITTHVPAFRQTVVDTMGAGDAFFAIASLFAYCKASNEIIGLVGNVAGAMKVGTIGHREPTDPVKFKRYVQTLLK